MQARPMIKVVLVGNAENKKPFTDLIASNRSSAGAVGVNFAIIPDQECRFQIWNISDMDRFNTTLPMNLNGADAIILFNPTQDQIKIINENKGGASIIKFDEKDMTVESCLIDIKRSCLTPSLPSEVTFREQQANKSQAITNPPAANSQKLFDITVTTKKARKPFTQPKIYEAHEDLDGPPLKPNKK